VSLRIAFDLDGVLADMERELIRQAEALFGHVPAPAAVPRPGAAGVESDTSRGNLPPEGAGTPSSPDTGGLSLTSRQQHQLWRHVAAIENFWQTLDETEPGIVARLAAVTAERRWEVIFLTKRPASAGATAQVQSQRWLEAKGFPRPSAYVVNGSRGQIAAAMNLGVVVDDRPENCLDVISDSSARAILIWRGEENGLVDTARRLGIEVVESVDECLRVLGRDNQTDRAAGRQADARRRRRPERAALRR
jgi:hypothetical protein